MSELDRYIHGVPCWADTSEPDPEAGAKFYADLFGWETENVMPPDSPAYVIGRIDGKDAGAVGAIPDNRPSPPRPVWTTYVWVDSVDATTKLAAEAGGSVIAESFDVGSFGRMAVLADPEGATFATWEPNEHRGALHVNGHGGVAFNELATRDLETTASFYGELFGWEVLDLGAGLMWTLPGYGHHLDRLHPGTLEAFAEGGAPAGFENTVASIRVIHDEPDTPARWEVTFGVDDVDETAALARRLGAEVLVEPFDAPWVRNAVVADPQGAVLTLGQYVPENAPGDLRA